MRSITIMISSIGRRNYLVDWFRQAGSMLGISTTIVTSDADSQASAFGTGDVSILMPRFAMSEYIPTVLDSIDRWNVDLVLSANDYDISWLSRSDLASSRALVAVPPVATLSITEDKYAAAEALKLAGVSAPRTLLGGEVLRCGSRRSWNSRSFVVKHRYGSGSSGVFVVPDHLLEAALQLSTETAPDSAGVVPDVRNPDYVVVQERVEGVEYGIDVVCDFDGRFQAVLSRRKLRMRSGETDQAITVDPSPFVDVGRALATALRLSGNTDVDVIFRPDGTPVVIDINPRFGGGYPFSHLAGANVPACYVAWAIGRDIDPSWLRSSIGVRSSKYSAIRRVGG